MVQEWWGVTNQIRGVADRLAAAGFVALAPDLYGGCTTHDAIEASRLMKELPLGQAVEDLKGAAAWLLQREDVMGGRVGALGFCMGGAFVLALAAVAADHIGAVVPYYPVGPYDEVRLADVQAPVLAHFAELDPYATPAQAAALERELKDSESAAVEIIVHRAVHHGFSNEESTSFAPSTADAAWNHTHTFLMRHLSD